MARRSAELPLRGVRVIDLSRYVAGPFSASILADLGGEVIRVEPVGGGDDRGLVPIGKGAGGALFLQTNRNKKSVALDIRRPPGRSILKRLVQGADVVITNLPVKELVRQSLDHASLARIRRDIITANVSALGTKGRLRDRSGFDGVGQGMSGAAYLAGKKNAPARSACSYVDYGTGLAAALGVLAALIHRRETGKGQDVHASLLATALTISNASLIEEALCELNRPPFGNRSPNTAPSDIVKSKDGFIVVQVIGDQMFARWAKLMNRLDFLKDPSLVNDAGRGRQGARLSRVMAKWALHRTSAEAVEILNEHGIPAGPVYSPRQVMGDAMIAETQVFQAVKHRGLRRPVPLAGPIVRLGRTDGVIRTPAPFPGEHTVEVLEGLGIPSDEIESLSRQGIISRAAEGALAPRRKRHAARRGNRAAR